MTKQPSIQVEKASGELEPFAAEKVRRSLRRAGADKSLIDQIVAHIKPELYDGIPTEKIHSHIFELLKQRRPQLLPKYSLKRAIMQLGPTGYPFERFVAGVLECYGYQTEVNQIIPGRCVQHEVDIIARKGNRHFMIESKFHNRLGTKTDIKDALYTYARFLDLKSLWEKEPGHRQALHQPWLVTNTKVTTDVINYARCVGMKVTAWDYPKGKSLRLLVSQSNLHPVTALDNLTDQQKTDLLNQGTLFIKDLPVSYY